MSQIPFTALDQSAPSICAINQTYENRKRMNKGRLPFNLVLREMRVETTN